VIVVNVTPFPVLKPLSSLVQHCATATASGTLGNSPRVQVRQQAGPTWDISPSIQSGNRPMPTGWATKGGGLS
jgi:hypothetical protein